MCTNVNGASNYTEQSTENCTHTLSAQAMRRCATPLGEQLVKVRDKRAIPCLHVAVKRLVLGKTKKQNGKHKNQRSVSDITQRQHIKHYHTPHYARNSSPSFMRAICSSCFELLPLLRSPSERCASATYLRTRNSFKKMTRPVRRNSDMQPRFSSSVPRRLDFQASKRAIHNNKTLLLCRVEPRCGLHDRI